MNTYPESGFAFTQDALTLAGSARLAYVRKVYAYFGLGLISGVVGALISMNSPLVMFMARYQFIGMLLFLGLAIFASRSASSPTRAVPTLVAFTFFSGLILSPTLYAIAHHYVAGVGVEAIYEALFLTSFIFAGLTTYVFITKKDFSYMGASLTIGLFLIIGASLVNIFVQSSNFQLAIAFVTTILFSGFILFDTSRILKNAHAIPPTLGALSLFLDFLNLFMALLQILTGGRRRD